jgi:hypothetical protein
MRRHVVNGSLNRRMHMGWSSKIYLTKELWSVNGRKDNFMKMVDFHISPGEILNVTFNRCSE